MADYQGHRVLNPWAGTRRDKAWTIWWAWYPVTWREEGKRIVVFFEPVWRAKVKGKWLYQLAD
jgi:hypothetical protein